MACRHPDAGYEDARAMMLGEAQAIVAAVSEKTPQYDLLFHQSRLIVALAVVVRDLDRRVRTLESHARPGMGEGQPVPHGYIGTGDGA